MHRFFCRIKIILLILIFFSITEYCSIAAEAADDSFGSIEKIMNIIEEKWFYNLTPQRKQKIKEEMINVIFRNLRENNTKDSNVNVDIDKYALFLNQKETRLRKQFFSGFIGIGITVAKPQNEIYPIILEISKDSLANNVLQEKDIILEVNDICLKSKSLQEISEILQFKEKQKIFLKIQRGKDILLTEVPLKKINTESVTAEVKKDILIIKIKFFIDNTYKELIEVILKYKEYFINNSNNKKIPFILDLRDNPGGYLYITCKIAELFLEKDQTILSIIGKNHKLLNVYKSHSESPILKNTIPIILLNKQSTSAAEVLASAIRENAIENAIENATEMIERKNAIHNLKIEHSIIIGENSYGKISVQEMIDILDGTMKITTSKYYTPKGNDIEYVGIKPDIYIKDENRMQYKQYNCKTYQDLFEVKKIKDRISLKDKILDKALEIALKNK